MGVLHNLEIWSKDNLVDYLANRARAQYTGNATHLAHMLDLYDQAKSGAYKFKPGDCIC